MLKTSDPTIHHCKSENKRDEDGECIVMNTLQHLREFGESLQCPLCHGLLRSAATFSTCGHTFCRECVVSRLEGPGITSSECPKCRQPGWKNDLQVNHQINNAVDRIKALKGVLVDQLRNLGTKRERNDERKEAKKGKSLPCRNGDEGGGSVIRCRHTSTAKGQRSVSETTEQVRGSDNVEAEYWHKAKESSATHNQNFAKGCCASSTDNAPSKADETSHNVPTVIPKDTSSPDHKKTRTSVGAPIILHEQVSDKKNVKIPEAVAKTTNQSLQPGVCLMHLDPPGGEFDESWEKAYLDLPPPQNKGEIEMLNSEIALIEAAIKLCQIMPMNDKDREAHVVVSESSLELHDQMADMEECIPDTAAKNRSPCASAFPQPYPQRWRKLSSLVMPQPKLGCEDSSAVHSMAGHCRSCPSVMESVDRTCDARCVVLSDEDGRMNDVVEKQHGEREPIARTLANEMDKNSHRESEEVCEKRPTLMQTPIPDSQDTTTRDEQDDESRQNNDAMHQGTHAYVRDGDRTLDVSLLEKRHCTSALPMPGAVEEGQRSLPPTESNPVDQKGFVSALHVAGGESTEGMRDSVRFNGLKKQSHAIDGDMPSFSKASMNPSIQSGKSQKRILEIIRASQAAVEESSRHRAVYVAVGSEELGVRAAERLKQAFDDAVTWTRDVDGNTTHVLVQTDDRLVALRRNARYLKGLALGCWIVAMPWVDACVESGRLVKEKGYEVKGVKIRKSESIEDAAVGGAERARHRRARNAPGIFSGMKFYVRIQGERMETSELVKDLLRRQGGMLLDRIPERGSGDRERVVVVGSSDVGTGLAFRLGSKIPVVEWRWVLDCTTTVSVLPWKRYLFSRKAVS